MSPMSETPEPVAFWLSFCGDEGFRGAAIIEAPEFTLAVFAAWACGANPGGEVAGYPLPQNALDRALAIGYVPNRLYSKAEINIIDKAVPMRFQ